VGFLGDCQEQAPRRLRVLKYRVVKRELSEGELQILGLRMSEETFDLDGDFLALLVRRDQSFRPEVDVEVLLADLEELRASSDRPPVGNQGGFHDSVVEVSSWHLAPSWIGARLDNNPEHLSIVWGARSARRDPTSLAPFIGAASPG